MLVNAVKSQQNPLDVLQQMAGGNPQAAQAFNMIRGKSAAELRQMAENMAKERGVSINDVLRQMVANMAKERGVSINDVLRQLGINNASFR